MHEKKYQFTLREITNEKLRGILISHKIRHYAQKTPCLN